MRSFRFPRFTIFMMAACFLTVSSAILLAAEISRRLEMPFQSSLPSLVTLWWEQLPAMFVTGVGVCAAFGAIGYGVLFVLGRTGRQRLASLDIRR